MTIMRQKKCWDFWLSEADKIDDTDNYYETDRTDEIDDLCTSNKNDNIDNHHGSITNVKMNKKKTKSWILRPKTVKTKKKK